MVEAIRFGLSLMQSQRLKTLINSAFLMNYTPPVFTYLSDTPEGRRLSKLGGLGLGISDLLASAVLRRMTTPISQLPTDDEGLANLRSEEHTSELQSLMRISYAVFCLKKKTKDNTETTKHQQKTSIRT